MSEKYHVNNENLDDLIDYGDLDRDSQGDQVDETYKAIEEYEKRRQTQNQNNLPYVQSDYSKRFVVP